MAAMWADAGVTRFISGRPFTREECWARLLRYAGLWPTLGFGYWAIEDKAEGRFLGEAGFADFKRDMTPSIEGLPEAGWVLAPSEGFCYRGRFGDAELGRPESDDREDRLHHPSGP